VVNKRIQYQNESEIQGIIDSNSGLILKGYENITEGNFIVFVDEPGDLESRIENIEDTQDIIILKLDGVIA
jgi:hypothetical protein